MLKYIGACVLALSFVSGATSLIYQIVFERLVRVGFGGDNISLTITVVVFLFALGVGAALSSAPKHPVRTYAILELAIGLYAILLALGFDFVISIADKILPIDIDNISTVYVATLVGSFAILLIPAILMGATLPVMVASVNYLADLRLGTLYAINTAGAAAGVVIAPWFLLSVLPADVVLMIVGATNISLSVCFVLLAKKAPKFERTDFFSSPNLPVPAMWKSALMCFLSGGLIYLFEAIFIDHAFMQMPSSAYNFPFVLLAVLLTMAFSSYFWTRPRLLGSESAPSAMLLIGAGGALLTPTLASRAEAIGLDPSTTSICTTILYYVVVVGPSIFGIAGLFPYYCSRAETGAASDPKTVSRLYFISALGTITVAGLTLTVLVPNLGRELTFVGACVSCVLAAMIVLPNTVSRVVFVSPAAAMVVLAVFLNQIPSSSVFFNGLSRDNIDKINEGISGRAAITVDGHVVVNGQNMGSYPVEERTLRQLGPSLLADPSPRSVLVLGLGSGSIFRQLDQIPSIVDITVVDWSREVTDLLLPTATQSSVSVANLDASRVVKVLPREGFDMIFDNLSFTTWVGSTGVKTPAFFNSVSRLLSSDGIYAFATNYRWHHRDMVLRGVLGSFRHVIEYPQQDIVLATNEESFDPEHICIERRQASFGASAEALLERNNFDCNEYVVVSNDTIGQYGVITNLDYRQEYIYKPRDFFQFFIGG